MKTATISSLLPLAANAAFTALSARSASPIHLQEIVADGGFWIGKETQSYCPSTVEPNCPPGNITVFDFPSDDGSLFLDVEVPGGQQGTRVFHLSPLFPPLPSYPSSHQYSHTHTHNPRQPPQTVYIDPTTSQVLFSIPHGSAPQGSILNGWLYIYNPDNELGSVTWEDTAGTSNATGGLVACPTSGSGQTGQGPWQIYAYREGFDGSRCLGFDIIASNYTGEGAAAWEYV
ncbi:MAG: hypothetical protein M1820_008087 [Bogoriella megaspora]|nr:MAG: hypothetical protein M1820_008087 [Bogoriella megaspora]